MQFRVTLSWITVTMLALSAEGAAVAQSAPAHSGSASDPPGRIEEGSASAGPELAAARASLTGATKTKKSDTGAAVSLDSLANRQAAAGSTVAGGLALPTGAGGPIQSNAGGGESLQALHGDATGVTSATAGPAIRFVPVGGLQAGGASMSAPAPHAEAVLRGQINPAAKVCYENDPDSKSRRPGKLVILIKLTGAGEIDSVSESSNIGVSPSVVSCIATAARAAKFAAPGANGATVRAAFAFAGREDAAPPAAARALDAQVANASAHAAPPTLAKADTEPTNSDTAHR